MSDLKEAERTIREAVWAALSDWLVRVSRRVLRGQGQPPDPDAVWALEPRWREVVDRVILPAMETAWRRVTGSDAPWEGRVFLARHLAEVRNRLVRVPEETFDLIAGEISEGVNLGEGIPQLANRIDEVLSVTGSERWQNRATVIARTEAIGGLNAARLDSFREMAETEGGQFEKVWVATEDPRTRPSHVAADGQRVPLDAPFIVGGFELMFPGDPSGPPQEVISCRCSMLLVEVGEEIDMSNRQMRGGRA